MSAYISKTAAGTEQGSSDRLFISTAGSYIVLYTVDLYHNLSHKKLLSMPSVSSATEDSSFWIELIINSILLNNATDFSIFFCFLSWDLLYTVFPSNVHTLLNS